MSRKHQYTTSDYLEWDTAMNLVRRLYKDGNYRMSLLIGCGCFMGLRFSDLRTLTWSQLLNKDRIALNEQKTGKHREIRVNKALQQHAHDCYVALGLDDVNQPCFLNRFGGIISTQMVNRHFKTLRVRYQVKVRNFSTHSLRKTFGRRVVELAGPNSEMALIKLSDIFNHASPLVTRRYLGLRQEEISEVYEALQF